MTEAHIHTLRQTAQASPRRFGHLLACLLALLAFIIHADATDARGFEEGKQTYERGEFEVAAKRFEPGAGSPDGAGGVSSGLLHNLGNAEFKTGRLGTAILAWERARALDPRFRNTAANLRFARGQAGLDDPALIWHEQYSAWFSPDTWLWIATFAFWAGIGLLVVPPLLKRRLAWAQGVAAVAIAVFLMTLPALAGIATRGKLGVILAANTELRLTPTAEGELLGKLPEGETARIEKTRGAYVFVRASNDRAGWVKNGEFAKIWP
jgi:hypothetical protein